MPGILHLLTLLAPVFTLIGIGVLLRRVGWLTREADDSLVRIGVNLLFPCLIFQSVAGNAALRDPRNLLWPPLVGFLFFAVGWFISWWAGRAIGLERGRGLRTFAFATGFNNYAYMAVPLVGALFGPGALAVLFVHNIGIELAIWTVGILLLAGGSLREGWRRLASPPVLSLLAALGLTFAEVRVPEPLRLTLGALAGCAVPVGLLMTGAVLEEHLRAPRLLLAPRVLGAATVVRLGLLPLLLLAAARWLPLPEELRQVMIVQAAMPAGVFPIVLARHYGGQPLTAVQVVVGTTLVSLVVIPPWLQLGLWLIRGGP